MHPPRQWRLAAAEHEARHVGALWAVEIPVIRVIVGNDGSGTTEFLGLTSGDLAAVARCLRLWQEIGGEPSGQVVRARAEIQAIRWALTHQAAIASFARQLDCYGVLMGK